MLAGKLDGVSADEEVTTATLDAIRRFRGVASDPYICRRTIPGGPPTVWRNRRSSRDWIMRPSR